MAESIIDDIAALLDSHEAQGKRPTGLLLGQQQVKLLEDELRPSMDQMRCPHNCLLPCVLYGCHHVHTEGCKWPGIDQSKRSTLFDVPVRYSDADGLLAVEVSDG
jgi:hypothetical protein